jgi:hypothetical protein
MRGGKRKNAGRKPGKNKISYSTKLDKKIVVWLKRQANQSRTIETALVEYYNIGPTDEPPESDGGRG